MREHSSRYAMLTVLLAAMAMLAVSVRVEAQEPKARAKEDAAKAADAKADAAEKTEKAAKAAEAPAGEKTYRWAKVDMRAGQDRRYVVTGKRNFPSSPESLAKFDNYYKRYGFVRLVDPQFLPTIADVRREFQRDLRDAKDVSATTRDAFNHINELAFNFLPFIIKNKEFHPISRYNATLMLGDLNYQKATNDSAAIPLPKALPVLVGDVLMDPDQADAVRVAALIGILRHAESMREHDAEKLAAGRAMIVATMLKIVAAKTPPKSRTPDGHHWMRRQAVEILGALGDVGVGGKVTKAMVDVAGDKEAPLWLRCSAADSIGRLKIQASDARTVDPKTVADTLRDLAADICRAEVARANQDQTVISKEQLLADLSRVETGIAGGLTPFAEVAAHKATVADLAKKFEALYTNIATAPNGNLPSGSVLIEVNKLLAVAEPPKEKPIDKPMGDVKAPVVPDKPKDVTPEPPTTEEPEELFPL